MSSHRLFNPTPSVAELTRGYSLPAPPGRDLLTAKAFGRALKRSLAFDAQTLSGQDLLMVKAFGESAKDERGVCGTNGPVGAEEI